MACLIVKAPYEHCFELFFKDELGYPNFYRVSEILPGHERYTEYVLIAPHHSDPNLKEKISAHAKQMQLRYFLLEAQLQAPLQFQPNGQLNTPPFFEAAITEAFKRI